MSNTTSHPRFHVCEDNPCAVYDSVMDTTYGCIDAQTAELLCNTLCGMREIIEQHVELVSELKYKYKRELEAFKAKENGEEEHY